MNQKAVIPKHIDPRETKKKVPTADIINMSNMMHASGNTPYQYVRASFKKLCEGDFSSAMSWLDYAGDFVGVFYPDNSEKDNRFKDEINILRPTMLFLIEKFQDLKPEE